VSEQPSETRRDAFWRDLLGGSAMVSVLAVVVALLAGAVLIAIADEGTRTAAGYFFARPGDTFVAIGRAVGGAYGAMFRGAIIDPQATSAARAIRPITETLVFSVPLILAGLGMTLSFRAGMFNIGGQGQLILGAMFAAWAGFSLDLPVGLHLLVCVGAAIIGGGLWGFLPGILKARTGANEVIVTIMLNNVAGLLIAFALTTQAFRVPGSPYPKSPPVADDALFPKLLGPGFRLDASFLLAIVMTVAVWWLVERSTFGFELRTVGTNPAAARTAGISVAKVTVLTLTLSGVLLGLAGSSQVNGTQPVLTEGVAASYGFDAITVALLGRSRPWGTFVAGLLFGAFKAGGFLMQSASGTPIDIVLVVQSVIVLLIAAPPLVRWIFRLPTPGAGRRRPRRARRTLEEAGA